jgi:hypothetical protein
MADDTDYWLTTHWPPLTDRPVVEHFFLQDIHKAGCRIKVGDRLLIYQFKHGPTLVEDGKRIARTTGAEGVVIAAEVVGPLREVPPSVARQKYVGREPANWKWKAETKTTVEGYVRREAVNKELGYEAGNIFRGFNRGKGYKEIERGQYERLVTLLKQR